MSGDSIESDRESVLSSPSSWPLTDDDKFELLQTQFDTEARYRTEAQRFLRVFFAALAILTVLPQLEFSSFFSPESFLNYLIQGSSTETSLEVQLSETVNSALALLSFLTGLTAIAGGLLYFGQVLRIEAIQPAIGSNNRLFDYNTRGTFLDGVLDSNREILAKMRRKLDLGYQWVSYGLVIFLFTLVLLTLPLVESAFIIPVVHLSILILPAGMLYRPIQSGKMAYHEKSSDLSRIRSFTHAFSVVLYQISRNRPPLFLGVFALCYFYALLMVALEVGIWIHVALS